MSRNVERRFAYRSPGLYDRVVEHVVQARAEGIGWAELLARADPDNEYAERSVEGAIRELWMLGLLSVGGRAGTYNRPSTRRVWVSPLGFAALAGEVADLPWSSALWRVDGDDDEPVGEDWVPEVPGAAELAEVVDVVLDREP